MAMDRHDYAFPFRIDSASRQAQRSGYEDHVRQMIRQVLLTAPGERVNLPEFGCGLRQMIFAPRTEALNTSVKLSVLSALEKWLSEHIVVKNVTVGGEPDLGELRVDVEYLLRETQTAARLNVNVG